jgi:arylformamidase
MVRTAEFPPVDDWDGGGWIDISRPLTARTPVWPGEQELALGQRHIKDVLVSTIFATCHIGTHIDAPLHMRPTGGAVEEIPLERLLGPAEVVRLPADAGAASPADLPDGWTPRHPRVLLRTDSHPVNAPIGDGFAAASAELVHWLADRGVRTLGIDTPSVDLFSSTELPAHHALIEREMTWIEGLLLDGVEAGSFLLVALPLPLEGCEAAPVRAVIRDL